MRMKTNVIALLFAVGLTPLVSQSVENRLQVQFGAESHLDLSLLNESRHALTTAFEYFLGSQQSNGSWKYDPAITALVLYSLMLEPGYHRHDEAEEAIRKGYAFLETFVKPNGGIYHEHYRNYSTAVALMALTATGKAEYQPIIDNAHTYLIGFQLDEGESISPRHAFYGGIGYGGDDRPDLSNTQLALEAIMAAETFRAGAEGLMAFPAPTATLEAERMAPHWRKALVFLSRTQNLKSVNDREYAADDGGFIYETGHYKPERSISYGSMTCAGLKSLLYAGIEKSDVRVQKAHDWICDNYTVEENPSFGTTSLYYYFMTATTCLRAFGEETLVDSQGQEHHWREDFLKKLISLQREEGHWVNSDGRYQENIKDLATAYSVIAIKHALHEAY